MKQLITTTLSTFALFSLVGCGTNAPVAPSQNNALNKISNSGGKEKAGMMQTSMDSWFKEEWTPTVNGDEEIQKKYQKVQTTNANGDQEVKYVEDEGRNFTLQEYVDKSAVYLKAHPSDEENSNVKKLESMPVIGK